MDAWKCNCGCPTEKHFGGSATVCPTTSKVQAVCPIMCNERYGHRHACGSPPGWTRGDWYAEFSRSQEFIRNERFQARCRANPKYAHWVTK